jgi:DNA-binding transcriptional LysR family regulator
MSANVNTHDKQEPGWELYRSFLGLMRAGSLSGAARALDLTQPTLGRHLDALEQALGITLFMRTQQGLSPTRAAQALLPLAESMEASSSAILRAAVSQRDSVQGTVRITASEVVAVEVLPPILTRLRDDHPGILLELAPSNRVEDLLQREADIAVRMTPPVQGALIAKHLGSVELGAYAHRSYLERHGTPVRAEELANHRLIGADRDTAFTRHVARALPLLKREFVAARTDSDLAHLALIRAGFGIGICQLGIAQRDPALVRVFSQHLQFQLDTWLVMHEDLRKTPCCAVSFDYLARGLADYIASQSGISDSAAQHQ